MKYSIIGNFHTQDESSLISVINQYYIYKLSPQKNEDGFSFEVWLQNLNDKNSLFSQLKGKVDEFGGSISWHECSHEEINPKPCVIVESYTKEV